MRAGLSSGKTVGVMVNWVQHMGSTLAMLAGYTSVSPPAGTTYLIVPAFPLTLGTKACVKLMCQNSVAVAIL